jgi:hypothetical protein
MNVYFSEEVGIGSSDSKSIDYCEEFIIVDMPWKPIIQKKRLWGKFLKKCDKRIRDVWNVGFLDYNIGLYHKKILRDCSKKEAIEEGLYQLRNSKYIKDILNGKKFDDVMIATEDWYQFVDDDSGKLVSLNPKFSVNVSTYKYMPKSSNPIDIPSNMYLAGYYVASTMGGVSMEASSETGLSAGKAILIKYNKKSMLPIKHTNRYLNDVDIPFAKTDEFLYNHDIPPISGSLLLLILISLIMLFIQ